MTMEQEHSRDGYTYRERKLDRAIDFHRRHRVPTETCHSCSGSGHYDHDGSPTCERCEGRGRVPGRLHSYEIALSVALHHRRT